MTLSQRLLDAADAIEEFNKSLPDMYTPDAHWRPSELRTEAYHLADEEKVIAKLAQDIFAAMHPTHNWWTLFDQTFYLRAAKAAIAAGWVKS